MRGKVLRARGCQQALQNDVQQADAHLAGLIQQLPQELQACRVDFLTYAPHVPGELVYPFACHSSHLQGCLLDGLRVVLAAGHKAF